MTEARSRFHQHFSSNIFSPAAAHITATPPSGKRRDQSASELFGSDSVRLPSKPAAVSFTPRYLDLSASDRKAAHMYGSSDGTSLSPTGHKTQSVSRDPQVVERNSPVHASCTERRYAELGSNLFGRTTPRPTVAQGKPVSDISPTSARWHDNTAAPAAVSLESAHTRSHKQLSSCLFGHETPTVSATKPSTPVTVDNTVAELRKSNPHASNLFGRPTPSRPASARGAHDDSYLSHQRDWSDTRSEIMRRSYHKTYTDGSLTDRDRKVRDQKSHLFGHTTPDVAPQHKTQNGRDLSKGDHHQRSQSALQSSMMSDGFYNDALSRQQCQVVETEISGLQESANIDTIRDLCKISGAQVVSVKPDADPVSNRCRGKARVVLRQNVNTNAVAKLNEALHSHGLSVKTVCTK